jgi:hypothetical protein
MVALPAVANVIRAQFVYAYGSDANAQVALHLAYSDASPPDQAHMTTLATNLHTNYVTNLKPLHVTSCVLHQIILTDLSSASGAVGVWSGSEAGTRSALNPVSAETCLLINFKVARRYKGGHPRTYWPFGNGADLQDPQNWTSSFVTACQTGFDAMLTYLKGLSGPPVITGLCNVRYWSGSTWHQKTNGDWYEKPNPISGGPTSEPVVSDLVNVKPASQRRRMVRG